MHHIEEKGTNVTHMEHSPKQARTAPGLLAACLALLHRVGSGLRLPAPVYSESPGRRQRLYCQRPASVARCCCLAAATLTLAVAAGPHSADAAAIHEVFVETSDTTATSVQIDGNLPFLEGAETTWRFEYAASEGGPWTDVPGGSGTIFAAEADDKFVSRGVHLAGLNADTVYYARLFAANEHGSTTSRVRSFETSGPPIATTFATHTIHGEDPRVLGAVSPGGAPTNELQEVTVEGSPTGGSFTLCLESQCTGATGAGTIASGSKMITALHTSAGTFLEGEEVAGAGIPPGALITNMTIVDGIVTTLELSAAATESNVGVSLAANLVFIPGETKSEQNEAGRIEHALDALPNIGKEGVFIRSGSFADSYGVEFNGPNKGVDLPQMTIGASHLTPSGAVTLTTLENGAPFAVRHHFEYVTEAHFKEKGFAEANSTAEVEGSGIVGEDLPGLQPGATYDFRLVASNSTPGNPQVDGEERTLRAPVAGRTEAGIEEAQPSPCPNEALRSGHSAHLPDCRAYEQVTPAEKAGAQDVFKYGARAEGTLVGEDGDHFMLHAPGVQWGAAPDAKIANYFFTRTPTGWQMTAARPSGETGPDSYQPFLFSPDLTQVGLEAEWQTTLVSASPNIEIEAGSPGGPYVTAASIPRSEVERQDVWVAMSADASKLILQTSDHTLLDGHNTGTTSGDDLYEFTDSELRQVNVLTGGGKISACGAKLVNGFEAYEGRSRGSLSSAHAVSANGARVFFEDNCTHDLYMRMNGEETVDIGEYVFLAANPEGSELLLEKRNGETHEFLLYEIATGSAKPLFSTQEEFFEPGRNGYPVISEDLDAIYFFSNAQLMREAPPPETGANLYRYDIAAGKLQFVAQSGANSGAGYGGHSTSPDGQYFYWIASAVAGVPGGTTNSEQVYRYDSAGDIVQCMSCASPFDPQPKLSATFLETGTTYPIDGVPVPRDASNNGDYVFFDTPAALVPEDVDGEAAPEGVNGEHPSTAYSVSSDVYEWRKNGVDGCVHVQGCLTLISSGTGGYQNLLLGTTPSGDDVFFATHESLVPQDIDTAGDVYDARVGGGFPPPPPRPVECEGAACSTPASPPNDATPSSFTFAGAGNLLPSSAALVKQRTAGRPPTCPKGRRRSRGKCIKNKVKNKASRKQRPRSRSQKGGK